MGFDQMTHNCAVYCMAQGERPFQLTTLDIHLLTSSHDFHLEPNRKWCASVSAFLLCLLAEGHIGFLHRLSQVVCFVSATEPACSHSWTATKLKHTWYWGGLRKLHQRYGGVERWTGGMALHSVMVFPLQVLHSHTHTGVPNYSRWSDL